MSLTPTAISSPITYWQEWLDAHDSAAILLQLSSQEVKELNRWEVEGQPLTPSLLSLLSRLTGVHPLQWLFLQEECQQRQKQRDRMFLSAPQENCYQPQEEE